MGWEFLFAAMDDHSRVPVTVEAERTSAGAAIAFQARLPNGVTIDLHGCDLAQTGLLIEALGCRTTPGCSPRA